MIVFAALCVRGEARAGGDPTFGFNRPVLDQLSLAGEVQVEVRVPADAIPGTLAVEIDNIPVFDELTAGDGVVSGLINGVGIGEHILSARIEVNRDGVDSTLDDAVRFEAIALQNPDECEVLNDVECLLPDRRVPIPLGHLESAAPICNACTAPHTFRPDED